MTGVWLWVGFSCLILGMLAVDLGVLNRHSHVVSVKEAARWSIVVISAAIAFNVWIYFARGQQAGLEFTAGYLIELALSVDNIFVFILIFKYFNVPAAFQHRVLFWGIFGALIMRGLMIAAGWLLLERSHWIIYVFGAFLIVTGIKMARSDEVEVHPEHNPVLKLIRRIVPLAPNYDGQRFFTTAFWGTRHRRLATPLFVVLVVVESTDLVFAIDSIPAIFAVTRDPFLVFTSNVFAILGLRSMYFLLAGVMDKFHYLKLGLGVVLSFVGVKMLITFFHIEVPIAASLGIVATVLATSVVASLLFPPTQPESLPADGSSED
ncbi:MAG: TerC family protein [Gemmatimonadetes bacterium]|nr:TerC family protein [Gemmatimonadota bacterium]